MTKSSFKGQCHCGAIAFDYLTSLSLDRWPIRACQCGFCREHGALSTSDPNGELRFSSSAPEKLQRYQFAMQTAEFLICKNCGVYIGATIGAPSGRYGIANTRALLVPMSASDKTVAASYDLESHSERIARREKRWTPVTTVPW